jgi:thiol-disulfide isomerase/thioredoxin
MVQIFKQAFILSLLITFTSFSQTKEAYHIKLKVNGLQDSTCYLAHFYLNTKSQIIKDTTKCDKNGNIVFTGDKELPKGIYLISIGMSRSVQLIIGDQFFEAVTDTSYRADRLKIIKSEENKLFYEYQNTLATKSELYKKLNGMIQISSNAQVESQIKTLQNEIIKYQATFFEKNKNTSAAKLLHAPLQPDIPEAPKLANGKTDSTFALRWIQEHYFDYLDLSDEMYVKTPYLENKIDYYLDNLTYQIPDSLNKAADYLISKAKKTVTMQKYLISHIGNKYERPSFMGGDGVFVHVAEKYFVGRPQLWDSATVAAVAEKKIAVKNVLIGAKIQNAQLTDTTGTKLVPLFDVKAKYTLLFLYDPECGHCKERAPKVLAFSEKMKNYGLKVYAASTERDVNKIKKFIKTMKTDSFINVYDNLTITDFKMKYNTYTTPQVLLLDADKKIIGRGLDEDQMEDIIMKIEKQKTTK